MSIPKPISLQTREEILKLIEIIKSDKTDSQKLVVANDGETYFKSDLDDLTSAPFDFQIENRTLFDILKNQKFCEIVLNNAILKDGSDREEILKLFESPISFEIMTSPFIIPSGNSFEQSDIKRSIAHSATDPFTRKPLKLEDLIPNKALLNLTAFYSQIDSKILDNIRDRLKIAEEEILRAENEIKTITKCLKKTIIKSVILGIIILADILLLISLAFINRQLFGGEITTIIGELVLFLVPLTMGTLCLCNREKASEYIKNLNIKKQEKIAFVESSRPIFEFEKRVTDALLLKAAACSSAIIPIDSSPLDTGAGASLIKNTENQRFFGKPCAADTSALQLNYKNEKSTEEARKPTEATPFLASSQKSGKP
jgi:hypothetical protein